MLYKYPESSAGQEVKNSPDTNVLQTILNYSRSLEVKTVKKKKVLIHLN
jgi:hypothetical protein